MDLLDFSNTAGREIEEFIIQDLKEKGLDENIIKKNMNQIDYLMRSHYYFECSKDDFEFNKITQRKKNILKFIEIEDEIEGSIRIKLPDPVLPADLLLQSKDPDGSALIDCVIKFINNCLSEISAKELERIIFCGGGGQVLGLRSILIQHLLQSTDLQKSLENYEIGIRNVPSEYSATSSWIGGSILFSLSYADNFFTNKQTYYERKDRAIDFIDDQLNTAIIEGKI
jgi:actin-related protein